MTKSSHETTRIQNQAAATQAAAPKEIAFSVRLTADEHDLLKQAAASRGWTATNLIRTATLERAKHILNTSRVTTFNFKGLAVRIADQLFKPRTYDVQRDLDGYKRVDRLTAAQLRDITDEDGGSVTSVMPNVEEFPIEAVTDLKMAVRYGGGEFLNQILEYCEGLTAAKRSDVPPPLDPSSP